MHIVFFCSYFQKYYFEPRLYSFADLSQLPLYFMCLLPRFGILQGRYIIRLTLRSFRINPLILHHTRFPYFQPEQSSWVLNRIGFA